VWPTILARPGEAAEAPVQAEQISRSWRIFIEKAMSKVWLLLFGFFVLSLAHGLKSSHGQNTPASTPQLAIPSSAPKDSPGAAEPLTPEERQLFELGETLYIGICGTCHQLHGNGQDGLAPPLANSDWVLGSEGRLVRLTLQGVRGPILVSGKRYDMEMPGIGVLEDEQIAALLTYIRRAWNHNARPVRTGTVARIRAETEKRETPWTAEELLQIP
jgi:mono/diheme cytochrome c family protein